ncbi:TniQ family protein [Lysinibacillus sphaericus]|uniref:TniQ family protein n=1 Tax=Lysinibacillus sphaericus TaxID=1421 RepID=UPI001CBE05E0|nr:TniQ family protein [Lysinibacillus sphaericus]
MKIEVTLSEKIDTDIEQYLASRNKVYNLEPIGKGTEYVESLASYITRLADIHNLSVSTFLKMVISPLLERGHIKRELSTGISKGIANFINENGIITLECVNALEELTSRNDIINLTMLNWTGIFHQDIRSKNRKWCPKCLEQMRIDTQEIYEPLIWCLADIIKCNIHKIQLQDKCPDCNRELPYFHSNLQIGYCQYCKCWLGSANDSLYEELTEEEQFINLNYIQLIKEAPKLEVFPTSNFFSMYINKTKGNLKIRSKKEFSDILSVTYISLARWMRNEFLPNRKNLLNVMFKLNCTLYDAIYDSDSTPINKTRFDDKRKSEKTNKLMFEKKLVEALKDSEPKSLTFISEQNGYYIDYAKRHYPELAKKIQENYLAYMKRTKLAKQIEIETILRKALDIDPPISLKQLLKEKQITSRTARLYAPGLCKKISLRYKEYLTQLKLERLNNILEDVRQAAFELHSEGIFPSKDKIHQKLGNKVFLEDEIRNEWKGIVEDLGYELKGNNEGKA